MEISEIRMTLSTAADSLVAAWCSVSFDHQLAVHDLRVIRQEERLFVAMPKRRATGRCEKCSAKNVVTAAWCQNCGNRLPALTRSRELRVAGHCDIAHPLTNDFRTLLEQQVVERYREEASRKVPRPRVCPHG